MVNDGRMDHLLQTMFGEDKKYYYFNGSRHDGMSFIFVDVVWNEAVRLIMTGIQGEYALHELRHRFNDEFTVRPGRNRIISEVKKKIEQDWSEDYKTLNLFEVRLRWVAVPEEVLKKSEEEHKTDMDRIREIIDYTEK